MTESVWDASTIATVIEAGALVTVARVALWCVPFRWLRPAVIAISQKRSRTPGRQTIKQLSWAVSGVSRYVPRATCLTQALALHVLVRRAGLESRLCVGVAKDGSELESHAWVESEGKVCIGGGNIDRFATIMAFD